MPISSNLKLITNDLGFTNGKHIFITIIKSLVLHMIKVRLDVEVMSSKTNGYSQKKKFLRSQGTALNPFQIKWVWLQHRPYRPRNCFVSDFEQDDRFLNSYEMPSSDITVSITLAQLSLTKNTNFFGRPFR